MNPVIIQDYDPFWPQNFELLRVRIAAALEDIAGAIEHVGSTAVPGLSAKPIIDIDVLLASSSGLPLAIARLVSIGYEHQGDLGVPEREAFRAPPQELPHHLYVCGPGSQAYLSHIAFRDHLRTHREDADAYAELKRELAVKFRHDRDAYTKAKSTFIAKILQRCLIVDNGCERDGV